jgi:hypothetical protein
MKLRLRVGMVCVLAAGAAAAQTTYYVRPDGGTAKQCAGTTNAAYPGKGSNQPCAWAHPSWALEKRAWKLAGGDRLRIAPGSYRMGWGRPRYGWGDFDFNHPEDVHLPPLPSGPDAKRPTVVAGEGYEQGCPRKPELWGSGPTHHILDLSGTSNAVVACLEITDHATCGVGHPTLVCGEDSAAAVAGIFARDERGENVVLRDLDIHGLAGSGIAGRFGSVTMQRVVLSGNGLSGWNADLRDGAVLKPVVRIEDSTIEWNGCVEEAGTRRPAAGGCRGENSGGYGDGIGLSYVGGSWSILHSVVRYNTQDGLDLLYVKESGGKVTIDGVTAYGNAGNQIKVAGGAAIRNNVIVGNCAYFDGKPFSLLKGYFREDEQGYQPGDHCRANGDALVVAAQSGTHGAILNNTIVGEGDFLIWALCQNKNEKEPCSEGTSIEIANNILRGYRRAGEFRDRKLKRSGELVAPIFAEGGVARVHHNLMFHVDRAYGDLDGQCPLAAGDICADPRFAADVLSEHFDGRLLAGSPALDRGAAVAVTSDHDGAPRPQGAGYDVGAFEMQPREPGVASAPIRYWFDFGMGRGGAGIYESLAGNADRTFFLPTPRFDPAHPDPWRQFELPKEPFVRVPDPYGRPSRCSRRRSCPGRS